MSSVRWHEGSGLYSPGLHLFCVLGSAFYANPIPTAMLAMPCHRRIVVLDIILFTRSDQPERFTSLSARVFMSFDRGNSHRVKSGRN